MKIYKIWKDGGFCKSEWPGNYKIWKDGGFFKSKQPGNYAAITTQKIVGRLDCPSGKQAKKKNRIFLYALEDKPRGFRYCKICKPWHIRRGDHLGHLEKRSWYFELKPHIALWGLGQVSKDGKRYINPRWYVALNWGGEEGGHYWKSQKTLSPNFFYQRARSRAIKEGKELNLPVIVHTVTDMVVIWMPEKRSIKRQKEKLQSLRKSDDVITMVREKWW